jgi:hypothetical protein
MTRWEIYASPSDKVLSREGTPRHSALVHDHEQQQHHSARVKPQQQPTNPFVTPLPTPSRPAPGNHFATSSAASAGAGAGAAGWETHFRNIGALSVHRATPRSVGVVSAAEQARRVGELVGDLLGRAVQVDPGFGA